jgi:hypothetical protein
MNVTLNEMDIVIPVREGDSNESLRYCLRSIDQNMPHRNVIIAGYKPKWIQNVTYIAQPVVSQNKYRRVAMNIMAGAQAPDISEWFVLFNDDMFALDPVRELAPFHRGHMITMITSGEMAKAPKQRDSLLMTYNALTHAGKPAPLNYELHMPMIMNTFGLLMLQPMLEAMKLKRAPIQLRSFYGNMHDIGGEEMEDVKLHDRGVFTYQEYFPIVSTTADVFEHGLAGEEIRSRFPNKSKYEL